MAGGRKSTMAELATAARRPTELLALLRFRARGKAAIATALGGMDDRWRWCYGILGQVSRSFALVIMELEAELRDPVAIFYLVLRALDTVEDDTAVEGAVRRALCIDFHNKLAPEAGGWTTDGFGKGAEKVRVGGCGGQSRRLGRRGGVGEREGDVETCCERAARLQRRGLCRRRCSWCNARQLGGAAGLRWGGRWWTIQPLVR